MAFGANIIAQAQRIGVEGFLIGATSAALAAARENRIHAVVLNVLWSSLRDEVQYKSPFPRQFSGTL